MPKATSTKTKHTCIKVWKYLCFYIQECSCGKNVFATDKRSLQHRWEEHIE